MGRRQENNAMSKTPDLNKSRRGVIQNYEELEYGLRAVVRILGHRKGYRGYFIQEFEVLFASELKEKVPYEKTFIDHKNLKVIVKLPDPPEGSDDKEMIRHGILKDYTMGIDDLKTRAGLIVLEGIDDETRKILISKEKSLENSEID